MLSGSRLLRFIALGAFLYLLTLLMMRQGYFMGIQQRLNNASYDYDKASPTIVIVAVDEKTLQPDQLGPLTSWPRETYAKAIDTLRREGAKAIGIDITFPDRSRLGDADDAQFERALAEAPDTVLAGRYYFENDQKKVEWPNETLMAAASRVGWINVQLSEDGFVREVPVFMDHLGQIVEAFSLQVARTYLGIPPVDYRIQNDLFAYAPDINIPVITRHDRRKGVTVHTMYTNYFAAPNGFTQVSFADLLAGRLVDKKGNPVSFKNKIALIGPTAIDLQDDYLSPVSEGVRMPGVELHANTLQTILERQFLRDQSQKSLVVELLLLLVINLILFSFLRISVALGVLAFELLGIMVVGILGYEFQLFLNAVYPLFVTIVSFVGAFLLRLVREQKERRFLKQAFGHYVNKEVVEEILKNPDLLTLGGAKKELSIFFSDIRDFTGISETMAPDELVAFLNDYMQEMTEIVLTNHGTLDKYEGDALMAFWGAPLPMADHAVQACTTALLQQKRLAALRQRWKKKGQPMIHVRMGINSGEAVVGNLGSKDRFDYTAIGDAVNLASRLEGINKQYGTDVIISSFTYDAVKSRFVCRELDLIRVKGKKETIRIYELVGNKEEASPALNKKIVQFEEALTLYRERKFDEAKIAFSKVDNDLPAQIFVQRCVELQKNPPPEGWDGVWEFTVK